MPAGYGVVGERSVRYKQVSRLFLLLPLQKVILIGGVNDFIFNRHKNSLNSALSNSFGFFTFTHGSKVMMVD